ncbi:MAG TPA: glycosyltransferase family 2 protein, partial [Syntrophorhabdaceae bacterium]
FLAVAYFLKSENTLTAIPVPHRYLLLIPAHNEEALIGRLLESLLRVQYERNSFRAAVIADNCTDRTEAVSSQFDVDILKRTDPSARGKGFAIAWALKQVDLDSYDAVVIIDADNIIDPLFFRGLDEVMATGSKVIQCYNSIANPNETAFTKILSLARAVDNSLYHHAKFKLGLSSFLMGNGMCFTTKLLKEQGWGTSTMAEDLEYYATLVKNGILIGFAAHSRVYHQESRNISHATDQRLRWSSGKFHIARKYGLGLFMQGLYERDYRKIDASFPLILPNLSLMVNLTVLALVASLLIHLFYSVPSVIGWLLFLLFLEILYLLSGVWLTKMSLWRVFCAFSFAPVFLAWKACIDFKGIFGREMTRWGKSIR